MKLGCQPEAANVEMPAWQACGAKFLLHWVSITELPVLSKARVKVSCYTVRTTSSSAPSPHPGNSSSPKLAGQMTKGPCVEFAKSLLFPLFFMFFHYLHNHRFLGLPFSPTFFFSYHLSIIPPSSPKIPSRSDEQGLPSTQTEVRTTAPTLLFPNGNLDNFLPSCKGSYSVTPLPLLLPNLKAKGRQTGRTLWFRWINGHCSTLNVKVAPWQCFLPPVPDACRMWWLGLGTIPLKSAVIEVP